MSTRAAPRRRSAGRAPEFEQGLVPAPGELLVWRDARHYDHRQDLPCALCDQPTPLRAHSGEPAHKTCAEDWITANPVEARRSGRFASDVTSRKATDTGHA
ncbi:hypothetical protein OG848_47525 (plasmid) [Streptomyces canus]|uniref:hypothetical protein n=1 Tax=Streptomyces canus TaxID=58343 RepID=UPI002F9169AF